MKGNKEGGNDYVTMPHISQSKMSQRKKSQEKKGRDPEMQGTRGGRFGPHPVLPSLKQRNNGINT